MLRIYHVMLAGVVATGGNTGISVKRATDGKSYFLGATASGMSNYTVYTALSTIKTDLNSYGIVLGDGSAEVSNEDYTLSGSLITTISSILNGQILRTFDDDGFTLSATHTVTNIGTSAFTIREIGLTLLTNMYSSLDAVNANAYPAMVDRQLLDEPITLEPNGVGSLTYTIRVNYPTA